MKKYLQISIILGVFFAVVIVKNEKSNPEDNAVVKSISLTPSLNPSSANPVSSPSTSPTKSQGQYKNGTFTGVVADAYYGNIQVQVTITDGKISDVNFLQYPNDNGTSRFINNQAMPFLRSEAIQAQNENVDIVSGASDSSRAFSQSLSSALQQAK